MPTPDFAATIAAAYAAEGPSIDLGRGVHDGKLAQDAVVQVPLAMMNRHGLVAGATGTGKTKTLQGIAEQLSRAGRAGVRRRRQGRPVRALGRRATPAGRPRSAMTELGLPFAPTAFPVEFLSLGGIGPGVPVRATVSDFGPQLLAKVLGANETQEQSLGLVFHYADTKGLPLLDLGDLRALLTFLDSDEGKAELEGIGGLSKATVGVLLRALVGLEDGGGNEFFGEPQLDISDLLRIDARRPRRHLLPRAAGGAGQAEAVLDRADVARRRAVRDAARGRRPATSPSSSSSSTRRTCSSTARPRRSSSRSTQTVRLIRSKGVGVFFVTQTPKDVPGDVLGQLGNRVQHALRAFTPDDAKALKATVVDVPEVATSTTSSTLLHLDGHRRGGGDDPVREGRPDAGRPHAACPRPRSRMDPADDVDGAAKASPLFAKYGTRVGRAERARAARGARGGLGRGREAAAAPKAEAPPRPRSPKAPARRPAAAPRRSATSSTAARASRCRRRSCAASSGC